MLFADLKDTYWMDVDCRLYSPKINVKPQMRCVILILLVVVVVTVVAQEVAVAVAVEIAVTTVAVTEVIARLTETFVTDAQTPLEMEIVGRETLIQNRMLMQTKMKAGILNYSVCVWTKSVCVCIYLLQ